MAEQKCPNCGRDLPSELGQHSVAPVSGLVTCPHCGADVQLDREGAKDNPGSNERTGGEKPGTTDVGPSATGVATKGRADDGDVFTGDESTETFSGSETLEGVKEEIEAKPETTTD